MFLELLDSRRYFFNPHSLPLLIAAAGLLFVFFQAILYGVDRRIRTPLLLAFLASTIWLSAFHFMYSSKNEEDALVWAKIAYLGVPFLAVITYDLAVRVRGAVGSQKAVVSLAWIVSGVFAVLAFDSHLIARVTRQFWGYYPVYGDAGRLFVAYFVLMAGGSLWHLYRAYQHATTTSQDRTIHYIGLGLLAGYLAGVDFVPKLGAAVYPIGCVCVLVAALLLSHTAADGAARSARAPAVPLPPNRLPHAPGEEPSTIPSAVSRERIQEEERRRLGLALHDTVGQVLALAKLQLVRLQRLTQGSTDRPPTQTLQRIVDGLLPEIDTAIKTVQDASFDLQRPAQSADTLAGMVEWECVEFAERFPIHCQRRCEPVLPVDEETARVVGFILREMLTNVARHAEATNVTVVLRRCGDRAILSVSDNGKGITPAQAADEKSLGLRGMRERARLLSGELEIRGGMHGTTVTVSFPITPYR